MDLAANQERMNNNKKTESFTKIICICEIFTEE